MDIPTPQMAKVNLHIDDQYTMFCGEEDKILFNEWYVYSDEMGKLGYSWDYIYCLN